MMHAGPNGSHDRPDPTCRPTTSPRSQHGANRPTGTPCSYRGPRTDSCSTGSARGADAPGDTILVLRAQRERDVAAAALAAAQQEILGLQAQRERDAKAAELAVSRQVIPKLQARLGSEESQRRRLPDADVVATALTATQQETFELHAKRGGPSSSPAAEANATTKAIETAEQSVGPAQTAVSIEDPALQADKDDSHQLQHTCRVHCTSGRSGHGATSPALGAAVAAR